MNLPKLNFPLTRIKTSESGYDVAFYFSIHQNEIHFYSNTLHYSLPPTSLCLFFFFLIILSLQVIG